MIFIANCYFLLGSILVYLIEKIRKQCYNRTEINVYFILNGDYDG